MGTTASNGVASPSPEAKHDSEIREKPTRRRFPMEEKRRIVNAADACEPGTLGALLRREGIYSSHLAAWRKERDRGNFHDKALRERSSRKANDASTTRRIDEERENRKLQRRLKRAELILDIQKTDFFDSVESVCKSHECSAVSSGRLRVARTSCRCADGSPRISFSIA